MEIPDAIRRARHADFTEITHAHAKGLPPDTRILLSTMRGYSSRDTVGTLRVTPGGTLMFMASKATVAERVRGQDHIYTIAPGFWVFLNARKAHKQLCEALAGVSVPCGPQTAAAMKALQDLLTQDPKGKL